jgi:hypothetical protein
MKETKNAIQGYDDDNCIDQDEDANIQPAGDDDEVERARIEGIQVKKKKNGLPHGVHKQETDEPSGRDKRLSPKATMFAGYVMEGHTPINAYMKAYDCSNSSHSTITASANKLMRDPRVTLILEPLWQAKKEMILTDERIARQHIMAQLFKHSSDEEIPINSRLRSLELMGKAVGMFTDKVEQTIETVNVDTLKQELESSLALLEKSKASKKDITH